MGAASVMEATRCVSHQIGQEPRKWLTGRAWAVQALDSLSDSTRCPGAAGSAYARRTSAALTCAQAWRWPRWLRASVRPETESALIQRFRVFCDRLEHALDNAIVMAWAFEGGKRRCRKLPAPKRPSAESIPPLWSNWAAMTYTPNQQGAIRLRLPRSRYQRSPVIVLARRAPSCCAAKRNRRCGRWVPLHARC